jgi:hypothetical protein
LSINLESVSFVKRDRSVVAENLQSERLSGFESFLLTMPD